MTMTMVDQIDESLRNAARFLAARQDAEGGISDPGYEVFCVWETVNAARALMQSASVLGEAIVGSEVVPASLRFAAGAEVDSGLVIYNRRGEYGQKYCLETSCEYAMALEEAGQGEKAAGLGRRIRELQEQDGGWTIVCPDVPPELQKFPSVAAFALLALHELGEVPKDRDAALRFLVDAQREDGSWGAEWEYYGTPYYPMVPIARALRLNRQEGALARALEFLLENQRDDGCWHYVWNGQAQVTSPALQTALAIQACRSCGLDAGSAELVQAKKWLMGQQLDDGRFPGGEFPLPVEVGKSKDETVFATAQAIRALVSVR